MLLYRDRSRSRGGSISLTQRLRQMFASQALNGAVYEYLAPSLNQLSTGTTPVAVVTDPVGLSLDSRLGLVLGPELATNGIDWLDTNADGIPDGYTNAGFLNETYLSAFGTVAGKYRVTTTTVAGSIPTIRLTVASLIAGRTYSVLVGVTGTGGTAGINVNSVLTTIANGGIAVKFVAAASTQIIDLWCVASGTVQTYYWDNLSVKLLEGNHALQATAAARPTWSNRVNLLLQSNAITTAPWSYGGVDVPTQNADESWNLTQSAGVAYIRHGPALASASYTRQILIKKTVGAQASYPVVAIEAAGSNIGLVTVDTSNGVVTPWTAYTGFTIINCTATIATSPVDSNYWLVAMTVTSAVLYADLYPTGSTNATKSTGVVSANAGSAIIKFSQLEYGSTATRYQRVTTATDFDTVGFPYYLSFLGTDDSLTSATGGGGSAGFFWCGVVQPTGGAGTYRELFSDTGVNTGYAVYIDGNNKLKIYAGNGGVFTTKVSTATVDVGTKYLLTAWDDGTNLNVQINSAAAETVARPVVVAGTAGFTIGKDNGAAASFFIGNLYPQVYFKDTGLTAAQRAAVQAWVRAKGGM